MKTKMKLPMASVMTSRTTLTNAVGIDWSTSCPAACALNQIDGRPEFWYAQSKAKPLMGVTSVTIPDYPDVEHRNIDRARHLALSCRAWISTLMNPGPIVMEGYAFSATGMTYQIGENAGILKYELGNAGYLVYTVPPTVVKKFATGSGNAQKHAMTLAFLEVYPEAKSWVSVLFPRFIVGESSPGRSPLSDIADSYFIAKWAEHNRALYKC